MHQSKQTKECVGAHLHRIVNVEAAYAQIKYADGRGTNGLEAGCKMKEKTDLQKLWYIP